MAASVPGLALSWSSRDNKTWTFTLRTNARFSDGSRITAAGVRASLVRAFTPITNAQMQALGVTNTFPQGFTVIPELLGASAVQNGRAQAIPARAITAPNARTLRIVLEEPRSDLPERLTFPAFGIAKMANVEGGSGTTPWWYRPVSSGPFAVSSSVPNTSVTIVPNRRYYGTKAVLQKVEFKVVTNTQTAEIAYQSGDLDFVKTVYSDVLNLQSKGLQSQMRAYTDLNVSNFIVNGQVEPTDDPAVVRALAMAIDRTTLTKTVLDGLVQPTTTFTPPGLAPGYSSKGFQNGYRFNLSAARAELAKSKYGSSITIRAWASSSQDPRAIQAIAQMWQQNLGIRVSIQTSLNPAQAPKSQAANVIFSAQGATLGALRDDATLAGLHRVRGRGEQRELRCRSEPANQGGDGRVLRGVTEDRLVEGDGGRERHGGHTAVHSRPLQPQLLSRQAEDPRARAGSLLEHRKSQLRLGGGGLIRRPNGLRARGEQSGRDKG